MPFHIMKTMIYNLGYLKVGIYCVSGSIAALDILLAVNLEVIVHIKKVYDVQCVVRCTYTKEVLAIFYIFFI